MRAPEPLSVRMGAFLERYFLALMAVPACATIILNRRAEVQDGILHYYYAYADLIRDAFRSPHPSDLLPTYPMWGYGWVFAVTQNRYVVLAVQNLLAAVAVALFVRALEAAGLLTRGQTTALRVLVLVSLPWYAIHSVLTSSSIPSSLLVLSVALLTPGVAVRRLRYRHLCTAGALMGIAANFRSDVGFSSVAIAVVLAFAPKERRERFVQPVAFMCCIFLSLLPWATYTRWASGHATFTATSVGLVGLISYGDLPGNRYGITVNDDDPTVRKLLDENVGAGVSAVSARGDAFLRRYVRALALKHPGEYLRRSAYVFAHHWTGGCYAGEYYRLLGKGPWEEEPYTKLKYILKHLMPAAALADPASACVAGIQLWATLFGRAAPAICYPLLPAAVYLTMRRKYYALGLLVSIVAYVATSISLFAYGDNHFASPAYVFYLAILVATLTPARAAAHCVLSAATGRWRRWPVGKAGQPKRDFTPSSRSRQALR